MLNKTFKEEAYKIIQSLKKNNETIHLIGYNQEVFDELITACEEYTRTRVGNYVEETKDLIVTVIHNINENIVVSFEFVPVSNSIVVQMSFKKYTNYKHTRCFYVREIEELFCRGVLNKILLQEIEQLKKNLLDHITGE